MEEIATVSIADQHLLGVTSPPSTQSQHNTRIDKTHPATLHLPFIFHSSHASRSKDKRTFDFFPLNMGIRVRNTLMQASKQAPASMLGDNEASTLLITHDQST